MITTERLAALGFIVALLVSIALSDALGGEPAGSEKRDAPREVISDGDVPWAARDITDRTPPKEKTQPADATRVPPIREPSSTDIVAVLAIDGRGAGLAQTALDDLTEVLAARLTEVAGYRVVPREEVHAKLKYEQQASYRPAFDPARQIELGKALAATKTLVTRILRLEKVCVMTSTLYDLTTETAESAGTVRSSCSTATLMNGIDQLVHLLGGASSSPAPRAEQR